MLRIEGQSLFISGLMCGQEKAPNSDQQIESVTYVTTHINGINSLFYTFVCRLP